MPRFSDMPLTRTGKLNIAIFGPSQTKKTLWMARAAEAGYDVIFLMGEQNYGILRLLSPEAQRRVHVIRCWDTAELALFVSVVASLCKDFSLCWDDVDNRIAPIPPNKAHEHIVLKLKLLNKNTLLVLDSLTALVQSMVMNLAKKMKVDLTEGEKAGDIFNYFGTQGIILDKVLNTLPNLPCHFGMIAHSVLVEQRRKDPTDSKKTITTGYRTQMISSSGPHSQKISKIFQEVLYFNMVGAGYFIDTTTTSERDGGSRIMKPGNYPWDKLQFIDLVKESADIALPDKDLPLTGIEYILAGGDMTNAFKTEIQGAAVNKVSAAVINATEQPKTSGNSLLGLLKK